MNLFIPDKFRPVLKTFGNKPFTMLDIGAGNHSASNTKKYFPNCRYYGVDISKYYNNDEKDFQLMEGFYEMDLTKLDYSAIPDNTFDLIMMAHIIEHLPNGEQVIEKLLPKLKSGGYIYIEYPAHESVNFPSQEGTLNFFDDDTHCRFYALTDLYNLLVKNNMIILKGGKRRRMFNIFMIPVKVIHNKIKYGYVMGSVFWDLYGFANLIFAKKK